MKKAFLFLLFLPAFAFAQETENPVKPAYHHEIGLNLLSIVQYNIHLNHADINSMPGVYYKYHFGQNALRASVDYMHRRLKYNPAFLPENATYFMDGMKDNFSINAGYERSFFKGKFQLFAFSDLIFNYVNIKGERSYQVSFGPYGSFPFALETFQYGIAGGCGMRYSITPRFQLAWELAGQEVVSVDDDLGKPGDKTVSLKGYFNPVNKLGIAVSF